MSCMFAVVNVTARKHCNALLSLLMGLAFVVGLTTPALAVTIRVPAEQATIQAGIDAAVSGDTVLVADGTYTGPGNRDMSYNGKAIVLRSEHGAESTIIDLQADKTSPHRVLIFNNHEDSTATLEGFTIKNGYGPKYGLSQLSLGGAIVCDSSAPRIESCRFYNDDTRVFGGSIYCSFSDEVVIRDCSFKWPPASYGPATGGGIHLDNSTGKVVGCTFDSLVANGGAGIGARNSVLEVDSCSFTGNFGGGVFCFQSPVVISNSVFIGNEVNSGGAIACKSLDTTISTPAVIKNCDFRENVASGGGAVGYVWITSFQALGCTFEKNGAGATGGAIDGRHTPTNIFRDCVFLENLTERGGAAVGVLYSKTVSFDNCSFISNQGLGFNTVGGAVAIAAIENSEILNCVFYGNSSVTGPSAVAFLETSPFITNTIITGSPKGIPIGFPDSTGNPIPPCEPDFPPILSCTDVFGNADGDWVGCIADQKDASGNLSVDPQFCDSALGVFSVRQSSPCLPENNSCGQWIGLPDSVCLITDVGEEDTPLPGEFSLSQNYPNPFNPTTTISYSLPRRTHVRLEVYNILGRRIKTLIDGFESSGDHSVIWDGTGPDNDQVASGVYFYRLTAGEVAAGKTMILLK